MTMGEAIRRADEMQPNNFSRAEKIEWLRQLDAELWEEVLQTHEGEEWPKPEYNEETPDMAILVVPDTYAVIYVHWLQSRIDYALKETAQYNNSNAAFEYDLQRYRAWYNRTHMPLGKKGKYW